MSIDIVGAVTAVYEIVGPKLLRQCGYIVSCNSHANDLNHEIKNLEDASARLQHKVNLAVSVGDIIEQDVWTWLTDADQEVIKSKNLILQKNSVSCCFGFVPNPKARYVLGRGAQKSLPDIRALIERGKFDQVSYHPPVEPDSEVKVRSATSSSSVRYVDLKSRALVLNRIMAELNDHNKIGVHGMGGVGKTTLLKDVEKRARESGKFDDVVTVFVSQAPNIEGIKSKILNKLGSLGSNGDGANKKTLLILLDDLWSKLKEVEALEKNDNVKVKWVMMSRKQELLAEEMDCHPTISLGVLEKHEVWSFFGELVKNNKVEELKNNSALAALLEKCAGLPVSIEALAKVLEKKGLSSSDLVMEDVLKLGKESIDGSASLELSYNYLGDTDMANLARSLFRIIGLLGTPTVPILTLFKYTVGLGLNSGSGSSSNGNIMDRARRQVNNSLRMLQNASLLLESDDSDYVKIHDVVRDIAASIASRDDHALIFDPEGEDGVTGWSKDDIPKLNEEVGAAQDLSLLGTNNSNNSIMERARRHVITLRMIQDASFLLGSDDSNYVKIHEAVRDVAASIVSRDGHALVFDHDDVDLIKGWSKEKLKKSRSVYLPYSVIPKINDGWECPDVRIFIMEGGHVLSRQKEGRGHVEVPNSFYKGMTKLKVLDLRNAWLSSLPSSIQSDLCNLTTLFLHFCCIENVSVIAKLGSLQILSFVGSDLAHLPKEIGDLAKLRLLDLSQCSELKTIEPGTLEKLKRLEELYIKESFDGWEVEGVEKPSNSSLAELNCLPRLRTLEVCVPDTDTLPLSLPLCDLVRYKVLIGDSWDWSGEYRESRTLKFKENSKNLLNEEWLQSALQTTQDLYLDGLSGAGGSLHELCKERFKELKHLHLQNSSLIECIIWSMEWLECSAFTALESMVLEKMGNLENICDGRISSSSFCKLKVVRIRECHKLRSIFNLSLLKNLTELEEIEISDCEMVQQIVIAEQMDHDDDATGEEQSVAMIGCSNIFFGSTNDEKGGAGVSDYEIMLGKLRFLTLRNLPKITSFFTIEGPSESMETTAAPVFFNDHQKVLQPPKYKEIRSVTRLELDKLQRIELTDCKNVVHFSNSQVLHELVNLESLTMAECESLEDIFDLQGIESDVEILPNLYELKLRGLPKLEHIWKKNAKQQIKGCRKLRTVEIYECNSLRYFSSSFMCQVRENLTEINVGHCANMESIFLEELEGRESNASSVKIQLTSLKVLVISHCPNLKTFLNEEFSTDFTCSNKGTYWCYGKKAMDTSDLVDTSNSLFNQKVFLPCLESLILDRAGGFEKLWCGEIPDQSYCKLEYLHVESCEKLQTVIPVSLIERLHNLKQLWVTQCSKLEVVFDIDAGWKTKKKSKALMLPRLQEMKLAGLSNLRHVTERGSDDEILVGFPSLNQLDVSVCNKLINLISPTPTATLLELKSLHIEACEEMLEVIGEELSERYKRNVITFPNLTSLSLCHLTSLTCFSSARYQFNFKCLKTLTIMGCRSLKIWINPRSDGHPKSEDDDQADTSTHVLFNEKIQLPNLEELNILYSEVLEELWSELPTTSSFCKLKFLEINDCSSLQRVIPSFMVPRLQNLERLCITYCDSLQDIFQTTSSTKQIQSSRVSSILEGKCIVEESTGERSMRAHEGNMQLINQWSRSYTLEIPFLKTLVLDGTNGAAVEAVMEKVSLPKLEELEISSLKLTELWHVEPLVGSFSKLKLLQVENCFDLVKIIPLFMVKRLQNLEKLVVKNCGSLDIVCELKWLIDDVQDSEISKLEFFPFQNLAFIHVEKCERLTSLFSISGNHHQYGETTDSYKIVLPQLAYLRLMNLPNFDHLLQVLQVGQYTLELLSLNEFFLIEAGENEAVTQKVALPEKLDVQVRYTSFFGSTSSVVSDIVKALQTNQPIIGILGDMGGGMMLELERQVVKEEANLFDQVVKCWGTARDIQDSLGTTLSMVYGEADVQRRAERVGKRLLSFIRNKRLLLILTELYDEDIMPLEAVGIPRDEFDPKHFKIILVSEDNNKELLLKMGAKLTIPIGRNIEDRWKIFEEDFAYSLQQELSALDTNTNSDITAVLGSHQKNNQIIGMLRSRRENDGSISSWALRARAKKKKNSREVEWLLKEENLFDELVVPGDDKEDRIQEKLKTALGITISETDGLHEKAQCIRHSLLSNQEKRLVLVLENLNLELDLEAVGIPLHDEGLDPRFFKICLISKKRQVLQKMGAQQIFEIQSEFQKDGKFYRIPDGYMEESDLKQLADECGSDDLTHLLSKKLKTQGLHAWANALQRLKDSPFEYEERWKVVASL